MSGQNALPHAPLAGPGAAQGRRASPRYAADLEVSCRRALGAGRADAWPARLRDLSVGGIGLVLARRFEVGTLLAVDLVNPGSGSPRCLLARVTHVTAHAAGEWLVGLALLREVREDDLRAWGAQPAPPEARPDGGQPRDTAAPALVTDPGLARVCAAWPELPADTQAAILALAATAR
jgi:hypothetical protein